jgi:hypothetical protein
MSAAGRALAAAVVAGLAVTGCGTGGSAGPRQSASTAQAATPAPAPAAPPSVGQLMLRLSDLPAGFIVRPLDRRNLPSNLTGCERLEGLMSSGTGSHEQVEFFRLPLGPWLDEAVIRPVGVTAGDLTRKLADALARCGSVAVTEEGHRVRLSLAPGSAPPSGGQAHTYRASGVLAGIPLSMDIVLVPAASVTLLVTNTSLAGPPDPALTAKVTNAAVRRATTGLTATGG